MTGTRCRRLAEVQIELVRSARGQVDKLTGDGLMAIWFIDAEEREVTLPRMAIECAKAVVARIQEVLRAEQLDGQMDVRIGMRPGRVWRFWREGADRCDGPGSYGQYRGSL